MHDTVVGELVRVVECPPGSSHRRLRRIQPDARDRLLHLVVGVGVTHVLDVGRS